MLLISRQISTESTTSLQSPRTIVVTTKNFVLLDECLVRGLMNRELGSCAISVPLQARYVRIMS